MKNKLKNKFSKLSKYKYLYIIYYENFKKNIKRFKLTNLDITLCTSCFNINIYSITFLKEKIGISNIYKVKFSNKEKESLKTINNSYNEIHCKYINLDNNDETIGSVSCNVINNKSQFRFDINCFYSHSGNINNIKEWVKNKEAYLYTKDKEIASKVKNYTEIIEEENIDNIYKPKNITLLKHNISNVSNKKRSFKNHKK